MAWSNETKLAKGLVWDNDPAKFDGRFYWSAELPKAINDTNEVDENGNPILNEKGDQVVTLGLKSIEKNKIKTIAGSMLAPTDWMVIKASEIESYTVPSAILEHRAAIRQASNDLESLVDSCSTHAEFVALHENTEESPAPINAWPEEIN